MKNSKDYNEAYETRFSKAQIEVWEMKDKIYESVKDLDLNNALHQIMENSRIMAQNFIKERMN